MHDESSNMNAARPASEAAAESSTSPTSPGVDHEQADRQTTADFSLADKPHAEGIPTSAHAPEEIRDGLSGDAPQAHLRLDFLTPSENPDVLGLLDKYEIRGVIGRGGMGIVLRGYDPDLERAVAIKVLAPELASNATARKRFVREGQTAASVQHEHVVTIHAVEPGEKRPFLVMRCIDGPSLAEKLDESGPLPVEQIVRVGYEIALGLAAAHANNLVHRDIKPSNILLEKPNETVRITDFGLARAIDDVAITKAGVVTGTPQFMSPEQARCEAMDHRSDLFSLGCVLYASCTGHSPFRARTPLAAISRVCEDTPRPIREVNPDIPEWLAEIIDKLLEKNPDNRFQTAAEVGELLRGHLAHLRDPDNKLRPASLRKPRRKTGRRVLIAAGLVLLVLGVPLVAELFGWTHFTETSPSSGQANNNTSPPPPDALPPLAIAPFDADQARKHQEAWAKFLGVPVETTNAIGMKMRLIPPGQFLMRPNYDVTISKPFQIGTYEVTMGEFRAFVEDTGYKTSAEELGNGQHVWRSHGKLELRADFTWRHQDVNHGDNYPVAQISWDDAVKFCEWLSQKEGKRYRLPTESEWEWACRSGSLNPYHFGDDPKELDVYTWYADNCEKRTHPVGLKKPNPWGLFDTHGNVCEYCLDWHHQNFPTGQVSDPRGPAKGQYRVMRGGGYIDTADALTFGFRGAFVPSGSTNHFGMRVVCETSEAILPVQPPPPDAAPPPPNVPKLKSESKKANAIDPKDASAHYNLGLALAGKGKVDEAIACFEKAIALDAEHVDAHYNLGIALKNQGKVDEAIECYKKALALDPKIAMAHSHLGTLLLVGKGKVDEAIACYNKAIALEAHNAVFHYNLGCALHKKEKLDEAIACYNKAIALDPKGDAKAHVNLGVALARTGNVEGAIECYRKAIAVDPKHATGHYNLGLALRGKGKLDEAIACWKEVVALDPKYTETITQAHYNLGTDLFHKRKLDEAIACWKEVVALDPKHTEAHYNLGFALAGKGKVDEAIDCYNKAIALDPKLAKAHYNLGLALARKGTLDEAIACYNTAIALDPKLAKAHYNLGLALARKGTLDEAIACYNTAIALDPKHTEAHINLGVALDRKGDWNEAIACFEKAIALDPKYARAHYNLGLALNRKGKVDEAIACYQKAIELDPKDALAHNNLGAALGRKGKVDEAIECYNKVIALDPKHAVAHHNLGLALNKVGRKKEAIEAWRQAVRLSPSLANAQFWLGTTLRRQGRPAEAVEPLSAAAKLLPAETVRELNLAAMLAKAKRQAALETRLPALLAGTDRLSDNAERLEFADLCLLQERFAAATRLYADAFAAEPMAADDLKAAHRYNAACSAALAAAGKGQDSAKLDDQERTRLRQQALDWLRADLALYTKQLAADNTADRSAMQKALLHWQKDPDLTWLRDASALAKLPAEEQKAFAQLWADVAALLKKVEESAKKEKR